MSVYTLGEPLSTWEIPAPERRAGNGQLEGGNEGRLK